MKHYKVVIEREFFDDKLDEYFTQREHYPKGVESITTLVDEEDIIGADAMVETYALDNLKKYLEAQQLRVVSIKPYKSILWGLVGWA